MAAGSMRPGMAYEDMYELICAAKPPGADMIGNELLIAIFWEESLFNNIEQRGGTAWGFGQVEPLEMRHVETEEARLRGYYVMGLPPRNVIKRDENGVPIQARLGGALSPDQSVQVSAGVLCHYYYNVSHTMKGALEAYGGVQLSSEGLIM